MYSNPVSILKREFQKTKKYSFFYLEVDRSSPSEVFLREGVLKICSKFTGEHPCRSAISIKQQSNFILIVLWHVCSLVNLLHIFRASFPKNTPERELLKFPFHKFPNILYMLFQRRLPIVKGVVTINNDDIDLLKELEDDVNKEKNVSQNIPTIKINAELTNSSRNSSNISEEEMKTEINENIIKKQKIPLNQIKLVLYILSPV